MAFRAQTEFRDDLRSKVPTQAANTTASAEPDHVFDLFSRHPDAGQRWQAVGSQLLRAAARHAAQPSVHAGVSQAELGGMFRQTAMSEEPNSFAQYGNFLAETVVPHSVNMSSPRCFGHMTSIPPAFIHCVADLVCRLNQNLVKSDASYVLSLIERQTLAMLHGLVYRRGRAFYETHVQHEDSTLGIVSSGGTLANITALWCARNACFPRCDDFEGVEQAGLAAALRHYDHAGAVILTSDRMHYSIEKAAAVLGLGSAAAIKVKVDAQQRIDLRALEETIAECHRRRLRIVALVGIAGSTDCGSIDPLDELARIARRERVHFHVDAAWGLSLLFSKRHRSLLAGLEAADSVALDGHKQLCLPVGVGALLLRDPYAARSIKKRAPYILHPGSGDLGRFSIEGSRAGTALLVHASLTVIGPRGFAALIERHLDNAAELASLVAASDDFELLQFPQTNIVLYRYVPLILRPAVTGRKLTADEQRRLNELNQELQKRQSEAGRSFVSRTTLCSLEGYQNTPVFALRAVVGNPLVRTEDMKAMLDDQRAIASELNSESDRGTNCNSDEL